MGNIRIVCHRTKVVMLSCAISICKYRFEFNDRIISPNTAGALRERTSVLISGFRGDSSSRGPLGVPTAKTAHARFASASLRMRERTAVGGGYPQ